MRCSSTPHSECIFPQGWRTPTLGTSNNLLEHSHCGEVNKGPWNTWVPALCTHRKGKADERQKKWLRRGICGFANPKHFANTGRVPSKSSGVPSNGIRQAFCMPTAAVTNTSHPCDFTPVAGDCLLTAPNSAGLPRDLSPCPEISSLGYCHIGPCGSVTKKS